MKRVVVLWVLCCALFVSCAQMDEKMPPETRIERAQKVGVLRVASQQQFAAMIDEMKSADILDVTATPQSRSGEASVDDQFVSLRQHLIDQGLREFTDEELEQIIADSLEYEPEDSLIVDPYMMAVLNEDREVQIDDKIFRYIDEGLLIYDAPKYSFVGDISTQEAQFDPETVVIPEDTPTLSQGEQTVVYDQNGNTADLIGIEYIRGDFVGADPIGGDNGGIGGGGIGGGGIGGDDNNDDENNDSDSNPASEDGLLLCDGAVVPADKIKFTYYEAGGGDGSWIQKGLVNILSSIMGQKSYNITSINKFNSNHRMKVRMFDMDYWIYESCGMTVRMQKRFLGIWWRKKAQKIYLGWNPLEIEYEFHSKIFFDTNSPTPPNLELGEGDLSGVTGKYPTILVKDFPYTQGKVALFHIPYSEYDFQSGDIGQFYRNSMTTIDALKGKWHNYLEAHSLDQYPIGLYTSKADDCTMACIYPPRSSVYKNVGRKAIRWEELWTTGIFTYVHTFGESFKWQDIGLKSYDQNVSILRGGVFGAVQYGGELRACIIQTR